MLLSISRRALAASSSPTASPAVLDFLAPSCTHQSTAAHSRTFHSTPTTFVAEQPARKKEGNAPPSRKQAPRRKPLHSRHAAPSTSNSPVDILSQIRASAPAVGDLPSSSTSSSVGSYQAHNEAIHNIIRGVSKDQHGFYISFQKGWLPIRDAGGAARPKPQDLGQVLKLSSAELRRNPALTRVASDVCQLALWLLGEDGAPGVVDWAWQELQTGVAGAERVVKVWEGLQRGKHLRLRHGPDALDRAYKSPRPPPPGVAKHPAQVFGAYIAARSMLNSQSATTETFESLLPTLISRSSPSLRRVDERGNFTARIKALASSTFPSAGDTAALAHAWIRQVSLAQMWYFDNVHRTPGYEIVRLTKAYFRTSSPALAWELWELVREGVENEDVKWIEESAWDASKARRWLGEAEERAQDSGEGVVRKGVAGVAGVAITQPSEVERIDATALGAQLDAVPETVAVSVEPVETTVSAAEVPPPASRTSLPPAVLTQALVAPFISGFTRAQLFDQATAIWTWLPSRELVPGVVTWTALLHGYATRADVGAAEAVFSDMVASGVEPDVWAWLERISARFEAKQPSEAMEFANQLSKDKKLRSQLPGGRFPDIIYSRLIYGLLDCNRLEQAEEVLQQMEEEGVPPTIQTINALLVYHTRRKRIDLGNVIRCLQLVAEKGLEADVFTFTMVLQALLGTGQRDATAKLVSIMETTGIRPSVTTYGAIINHLANSGKADQLKAAVELIDEMERKGLPTNEIIYTSVIQGFLRAIADTPLHSLGDNDQHPYFTAALTLKDRMERRGLAFNRIGFNAIIGAALSLQTEWGVQLALRTFHEMESRPGMFGKGDGKLQLESNGRSVTPADTWYVLLDGFSKMGDWSRARALVAQMERSGFKVKSKPLARMVDKVQRGGYIG